MDIISLIPAGGRPSYTPPAPDAGSPPVSLPPPASLQDYAPDAGTVEIPAVLSQDVQRRQAVERAVQSFKDSFPVSDMKFTIYKDASGQYITRFTSLKDGRVTYYPEQTMYAYFQQLDNHKLVNIRA